MPLVGEIAARRICVCVGAMESERERERDKVRACPRHLLYRVHAMGGRAVSIRLPHQSA